jgi:hypothetical protein
MVSLELSGISKKRYYEINPNRIDVHSTVFVEGVIMASLHNIHSLFKSSGEESRLILNTTC